MPQACLEFEVEEVEPAGVVYTRPHYAERFRCIASACEDTCCSGWTIPVDSKTFASYQSDPILHPFTQLFVLNRSPDEADAARMPLTHRGQCAFLGERRLCSIQQNFGAERLPAACSNYPREVTHRFGAAETALNLSCPEAARITLLDPDLLGAVFPARNRERRYEEILQNAKGVPDGYQPLLALREFELLLLTDRTQSLAQRLQRMGSLSSALQSLADAAGVSPEAWLSDNPDTLARLLARVVARASHPPQGKVHDPLAPADCSNAPHYAPARQLLFAAETLGQRLAESPISARFGACLAGIEHGLGCTFANFQLDARTLAAYTDAAQNYLAAFLEEHPYLLENYVINHVFKYHYPVGRQPESSSDLNQNHLALCAQVALIQTLLVGLAAYHREELALEHVVTLVQTLARAVEHRRPTMVAMIMLMERQGLSKPGTLTSLLTLPA